MYPFDEQGVFGPKTLAIVTRAYKDARRELKRIDPGKCQASSMDHDLAKRIIEGAKKGERNTNRLRVYGLRGLIQIG